MLLWRLDKMVHKYMLLPLISLCCLFSLESSFISRIAFAGAVFIYIIYACILDWKKFINSEIQYKIGQLKENTLCIIILIIGATTFDMFSNDRTKELFWIFIACEAVLILFSWLSTYKIGAIILRDISSKKKSEFWGIFIESFFGSTSNLTAIILIISYIISGDFTKSFDNVVKTVLPILALLLPTIKMYNFIMSEYSEYSEEHFNDVEQFINSFESIDDLSNLEKTINEIRRKLEKGKFAGVKKIVKIYVKKFATLEDLDNLEKIIVEKRNELENNNDTEKHMD